MKAAAHPSAPTATVASVQKAPAADANNATGGAVPDSAATDSAGGQDANPGPPPALDLGTMQSGPDLAAASLAGEIKKAETPARTAALRVTEQARVELAGGKTDDALRDLGRAVSIDPGNPFEYFYLGRVYLARRNYAQALTFLKRAEIGFGARPDWLGETVGFEGACYEELNQTTDAAQAYRRALGSAPNNLRARVGFSRLGGDLTSASSADSSAAAAPTHEALPPPERSAAGPAPAEAPPPPPPAPITPDSASKKIPAGDYQPD
jgi:tetratricopeptide (TPR) repeat protein